MYLTDLCIRNVGPISACDIQPSMDSDGNPKPLILVGLNGSGKTLLLSSIADALVLMASEVFSDVVDSKKNYRPYFRICGPTNQRSSAEYSVTLLKLEQDEKSAQYIERTGNLKQQVEEDLKLRFPELSGQANATDSFQKNVTGFSNTDIEKLFLKNSYCFFPASRYESAHWQNLEAFPDSDIFEANRRLKGRLNKELITSKTGIQNRRWILDIMFDSRVDIDAILDQNTQIDNSNLSISLLFIQARKNIEIVLKKVLQDPNAQLQTAYRGTGSRLKIVLGSGLVIPSLSHLSLGQSILFNLFCTIIRHADANDLTKGFRLNEIKGIAIIDEAEVHLHETLRYKVLPELISLFPKVQFIISTHSPSLLLGLNARLGEDGFETYDLPSGTKISIDRFSEFEKSIQHLQESAAFESALIERVATVGEKPIVLTEGGTDPDYIKCALEVLGRSDLLEAIDIDWVGANDARGQAFNTGESALKAAAKLFEANSTLLNRKMMLIYDCDTKKPDKEILENLWQRTLPKNNQNETLNKGIENLLPSNAVTDEDYDERTRNKDYGGSIITRELNKRRFCQRICTLKDPDHFVGFGVVVEILDQFVNATAAPEVSASACDGIEVN